MNVSDDELIIGFTRSAEPQRRNDAFNTLYDRHSAAIFGYIRNRCGNSDAANDISQQVWTNLIVKAEHIAALAEDPALAFSLKGYLFGMAKNAIADSYREQRPDTEEPGDLPSPDNDPLTETRLMKCLHEKLRKLSSTAKDAFWLTRDGRLTYEQAGHTLHISTETVRGYVKDALTRVSGCKEILRDE